MLFIKLWEETVGATGSDPQIDNHTLDSDFMDAFHKDNSSEEMKDFYRKYRSADSIEEKASYVLADCIRRYELLDTILEKGNGAFCQGDWRFDFPAGNVADFIKGTCKLNTLGCEMVQEQKIKP